jgi:hypothetical protein
MLGVGVPIQIVNHLNHCNTRRVEINLQISPQTVRVLYATTEFANV